MLNNEKISQLRAAMNHHNIDVYMVFCTDHHLDEFISPYFEELRFVTGFTGYDGTLLIDRNHAYMYTDNRYAEQLTKELAGTDIILCIEDIEQAIPKQLEASIPFGGTLGFDGKYVSASQGLFYKDLLMRKNGNLLSHMNLVDEIWEERPDFPYESIFEFPIEYSGEEAKEKLGRVREVMMKKGAQKHFIASPDAICWMLNIRGNDIPYVCQALCFGLMDCDTFILYIDENKVHDELRLYLQSIGVVLQPYNDVYKRINQELKNVSRLLLDMERVNYAIYQEIIKNTFINIIHGIDPAMSMKTIKNEVEVANLKNAALRDSVAVTKFIYWLKCNIAELSINEYQASKKVEEFRREQDNFLCSSFEPLCAYGANAAMVFYCPTENHADIIEQKGFLLVDSGGTYWDGTTDITRTIALGEISDCMKAHYTTALICAFTLTHAKFPLGVRGCHLDVLARSNMWNLGMDYSTRSGHGLGYVLNDHEGPIDFKWKTSSEKSPVLEENMVMTVEPGVYIEGEYGIRLENDVIAQRDMQTKDGQFMRFDLLTYVPFDLDAILPEMLTLKQRNELNEYHKIVYDKVSPYLTDAEKEWLEANTKAI